MNCRVCATATVLELTAVMSCMLLSDGNTPKKMLQIQHYMVLQNTLQSKLKKLTIQSGPLLVWWIRLLFLCKVRMPPGMLCWWWHGLTGWTPGIHLCARTSCSGGLLTRVNLLFHKPIYPHCHLIIHRSSHFTLLMKMVRPHSEADKGTIEHENLNTVIR